MDTPLSLPDRASLATARAPIASPTGGDRSLLDLWVRSKRNSANTRSSYRARGDRFLSWCEERGIELRRLSLDDLLHYADSLSELSAGSQKAHLATIKALLTFGQKSGYLQFNVGAALELAKTKDTLAERILTEEDIQRMLAKEENPRRHLLIRVLYSSGGRVSEVLNLKWRDCVAASKGAGQITLVGKGGKTRFVHLRKTTWAALMRQKPENTDPDSYVFATKNGKPYARSWAWEIVKTAAQRAGLPSGVSPHWMRHAHVSHALDRGAPAHLVQTTVGHASLDTTTRYAHARPTESSSDYLPV